MEIMAGRRWERRWEWAFMLTLVLIAAFFRLYRLDSIPPYLSYDEAGNAVTALEVMNGHPRIFWPEGGGKEPIYVYLLAGLSYLIGLKPFTLRLLSALLGTATVLTTYLMVREMFQAEGQGRACWLAGLAALGLATSHWHLNYSRIGYRIVAMPLLESICFYFLWRGLRTGRRWPFALGGLFLGGSIYTYSVARFLPLVPLIFFPLQAWLAADSFLRKHVRGLGVAALVALVVLAPLAGYFLLYPDHFLARAETISILNPIVNQGDLWGTLGRSVVGHFGAFGWRGEESWEAGLPGTPILEPLMAVCFWLGVVLSLVRLKQRTRGGPYLFCVLWWVIMLIPSLLTPAGTVSLRRILGVAPVVYVFPAIFLVTIGEKVLAKSRSVVWSWLLVLVVVVILFGRVAYNTYYAYFEVWARSEALYHVFDGQAVDLVKHMEEETDPQAVFILPWDIRVRARRKHHTIDFLYHGQAAYHYLGLDDETVPRDLTEACQGKDLVHFVSRWKVGRHYQANLKGYVPFLLEKYGEFVSEEDRRGYDMMTYRLFSTTTDFTTLPDFRPLEAHFSEGLTLVDCAYGDASPTGEIDQQKTPSGERAWVMAHWRKDGPLEGDYKVSIVLLDEAGHKIGQVDKPLLNREYRLTSRWEEGEMVLDYYILPVQAATPPGNYQLQAIVYSEETMERLGTAADISVLKVGKAIRQPTVDVQHPLSLEIGDTIRLLGYDLFASETTQPGDRVSLALYWRAERNVKEDYKLSLYLKDAQGETVMTHTARPTGDSYPTDEWGGGEILRGWHELSIPAQIPPGEYRLSVALKVGVETGREVELTTLQVGGWARLFQVPEIQHRAKADLDGLVELLGYDLDFAEVQAGGKLRLTLYWRALSMMDISYTAFVHLLDGQSRVWGQQDHIPAGRPTTGWLEGEIVVDGYELPVRADAPPGEYVIEVGLYDPVSGERLSLVDEDRKDRVLLGQVRVR